MIQQFQLAVFDFGGDIQGVKTQALAELSPKWLKNTGDYLEGQGKPFFEKTSWGGPLAHIYTSLLGTVATFYVGDQACASVLLLCDSQPESQEAARRFVEMLRSQEIVKQAAHNSRPFQEILTLTTRPLAAIVVWAPPALSTIDENVVRELTVHFIGAFFSRHRQGMSDEA